MAEAAIEQISRELKTLNDELGDLRDALRILTEESSKDRSEIRLEMERRFSEIGSQLATIQANLNWIRWLVSLIAATLLGVLFKVFLGG